MSAALAARNGLISCAETGAWSLPPSRKTARRLWLPLSLSVLLHVLALMYLHDVLVHGRTGQIDAAIDEGLRVRLLTQPSHDSQMSARADNAATPLSNAALPGRAPDLAQLTSDRQDASETTQEKELSAAAPLHPQKQVDGSAAASAAKSASVDAVAVTPQASSGGHGNFDSGYVASTAVERAPIPLTQPNLDRLAEVPRPHAAIAFRAYVEATGVVHDVVIMSCQPEDRGTAEVLAKIYKDVSYIAAYDHGKQVASKIDFTITLSDSSLPGDRPETSIIRKTQP